MYDDYEIDWEKEDRLNKEYNARMRRQMQCLHECIVRKAKPSELSLGSDYIVECTKCEKIAWINLFVFDYIEKIRNG
jgi:hypothetical protein